MIGDRELKVFLGRIQEISNKYNSVIDETEEKLNSIIDVSQNLQVKLAPLSIKIDEYQVTIKNMENCRTELLKTQNYNRTCMEVEAIISGHPSGNLDEYLNAMDKVKHAIDYFKNNDPQNIEFTNLEALFKRGNESIEKEFKALLNQAFPIVKPENLFSLCFTKEKKETTGGDTDSVSSGYTINTDIFESVAECHETELSKLSQWLLKDESMNCIVKYCTCRREALRSTIERFMDWCRKNPNLDQSNLAMRVKNVSSKTNKRKGSSIDMVSVRRMSKKNLGIGHKEMKYLQTGEMHRVEFEEKEAKLFTVTLVALVKLMKNERVWLEKLNLTPVHKDKCGAMDSIVKGSINDLLSNGDEIIKMMNNAQAKRQYHHVINIILILERFVEVKVEFREILEIIMEHTRRPIFNLLNRFTQVAHQCLDVYSSYIETEKITSSTNAGGGGTGGSTTTGSVPADATVHELTTNTLRFMQTLLLHGDVTESILSNTSSIIEKIYPSKNRGTTGGSSISYIGSYASSGKGSSNNLTSQSDHNKGKNMLLEYVYKVIESVIKNMLKASTAYNNDIARVIFKINNLYYIKKTIESPEFYGNYHSYSRGTNVDIKNIIDENKMLYIATILRLSNLPDRNHYSGFLTTSSKIDSNTKAHIKDMWARFNESFDSLVQYHREYVVAEPYLRKTILEELKMSLLPKYKEFRDQFISVPFTTKRDKYIMYTVEVIEEKINGFFSP